MGASHVVLCRLVPEMRRETERLLGPVSEAKCSSDIAALAATGLPIALGFNGILQQSCGAAMPATLTLTVWPFGSGHIVEGPKVRRHG